MGRTKKAVATVGQFFTARKELANPDLSPAVPYSLMTEKQRKKKRTDMRSVGISKKREYLLKKKFGLGSHDSLEKASHSLLCGRRGGKVRINKLEKVSALLQIYK